MDSHRLAGAFHAACDVYRVAPNIVDELRFPDDARDEVSRVDSETDFYLDWRFPVEFLHIAQKPAREPHHPKRAVVVRARCKAARRHVRVADCLDFLDSLFFRALVEHRNHRIEHRDDFLRAHPAAHLREPDDIGEKNRHVREILRDCLSRILRQLLRDVGRQYVQEELLRLLVRDSQIARALRDLLLKLNLIPPHRPYFEEYREGNDSRASRADCRPEPRQLPDVRLFDYRDGNVRAADESVPVSRENVQLVRPGLQVRVRDEPLRRPIRIFLVEAVELEAERHAVGGDVAQPRIFYGNAPCRRRHDDFGAEIILHAVVDEIRLDFDFWGISPASRLPRIVNGESVRQREPNPPERVLRGNRHGSHAVRYKPVRIAVEAHRKLLALSRSGFLKLGERHGKYSLVRRKPRDAGLVDNHLEYAVRPEPVPRIEIDERVRLRDVLRDSRSRANPDCAGLLGNLEYHVSRKPALGIEYPLDFSVAQDVDSAAVSSDPDAPAVILKKPHDVMVHEPVRARHRRHGAVGADYRQPDRGSDVIIAFFRLERDPHLLARNSVFERPFLDFARRKHGYERDVRERGNKKLPVKRQRDMPNPDARKHFRKLVRDKFPVPHAEKP